MTGDLGTNDRRLHGLSDTMRAFAEATIDYQRLLRTVAERMAALLDGGCVLALVTEDLSSLVSGAVHFDDPVRMKAAVALLGIGPIPVTGSSLGARIIQTRQGVLIPNVDEAVLGAALSDEYRPRIHDLGLRSLIVLPLEIRGRILGILSLCRVGADSAPFNEDDEAVARNLAEHAALAISNAQLLESRQREIEDRKRAEEQARRFEALIQHSGDFIAMAGLEGKVSFVNTSGKQLLGIPLDADVSKLDLRTFHTDDGMKRAAIIREHGRYQGPGQLRHFVTGELIDTQVSSFLVRDALGEPFGFATVQHDVREMKNLEAHLRQMQRLEALGRLAGGIAHDFNNILSIILSYSTILLAELPAGTPAVEDVQEIHVAGERAARLTRQLLAFSRRQVLEPRIVDLNEVVLGMDKMTRRLLGEDILLKTELSPTLGRVKVDVGQFEQVLLNLAINARDAMPNGGALTIATANVDAGAPIRGGDGGRCVRLSVSDTGAGMDEATRQRAFEPFFTTKANGKGTGLGLATVFGVIEQSGGRISVSSEPGRGASFVIHLPRCDEEPTPLRVSLRPAKRTAPESATILLVEDEAQVRKLIRAILSGAGYRVLEAPGPLEALRESEQFPDTIHLLVTDVVMPTMNGRELAELLKRRRQQTKVLYLSGYTEDAIAQHGVVDPSIALLQKPVTPDALLERVREVLDSDPVSDPLLIS
jgi:two-component system cell cycle sensor histidine kinase/response regulator CckA